MKGLTEIVFILDRSGSMAGLEEDTIGSFNSLIEKQKKEPGVAVVSTVLFDDVSEVLHNRVLLADIPPMTDREYYVRGTTALLDAIGGAVRYIGLTHNSMRAEDRPEKTLFVIVTDGMENASRRYGYRQVKQMISRQKERYHWEFLFLGANIDAIDMAGRVGIDAAKAANYCCDKAGTEIFYEAVGDALHQMRQGQEITAEWKEEIERDYNRRRNS